VAVTVVTVLLGPVLIKEAPVVLAGILATVALV
jgi:hypothetical protein